ncbi:MAG: hypothetical protein AAB446_02015 [Patescibacteria group bacterium]
MTQKEKYPAGFIPDTIAYIIYCASGIGSSLFEKFVLDFTWTQLGLVHLVYASRFPFSFLCGKLDDYLKRYFKPKKAAILALCFFGSFFYIVGAVISGILLDQNGWVKILLALAIQNLSNVFLWKIYDYLLYQARRLYVSFKNGLRKPK